MMETMGRVLGAFAIGAALCGCVRVARVGTTHDGRPQFQLNCAALASSEKCSGKAREACGGDYEMLSVSNKGPVIQDGNTVAPGGNVYLIACHRKDAPGPKVEPKAEQAQASTAGEVLRCARKRRRNRSVSCGG